MKRFLPTTLFVLVLLLADGAFAQTAVPQFVSEQKPLSPPDFDAGCQGEGLACPAPCEMCGHPEAFCGCGPTWYFELEAIAARYRRGNGTSYDASNPAAAFDDDRQLIPRLTGGVVLGSGLGVRLRYFDYDHSDTNPDGVTGHVDANVIDLELFENLRLTNSTALEWSIGVRRNEFTETVDSHPLLGDDLFGVDFEGYGVIAGLEVNRMVRWGSVYARGRGALLMGDREVAAPGAGYPLLVQQDVTPGMLELAIGWEFSHVFHNGLVLTSGIGWEVQQWMDGSVAATAASLPTTSPVDVGFDGAIFSFAVGY
jgi:hypothetical protein